jgi:hypothetical protein
MHSLRISILLALAAALAFAQLPAITTASLPNGTTGGAYSAALSVTGGTAPYSNWTVGAGTLPPGLKLDSSTGQISGIPATSGTFNFWITVQDGNGGISPAAGFTVITSVPMIVTASTDLAAGVVNSGYTATLTATGGTPPYLNWNLFSGALPQGLFLDPATGTISGTPIISSRAIARPAESSSRRAALLRSSSFLIRRPYPSSTMARAFGPVPGHLPRPARSISWLASISTPAHRPLYSRASIP